MLLLVEIGIVLYLMPFVFQRISLSQICTFLCCLWCKAYDGRLFTFLSKIKRVVWFTSLPFVRGLCAALIDFNFFVSLKRERERLRPMSHTSAVHDVVKVP